MYFENCQSYLWKSDKPVSKVCDFKNGSGKFFRSKFIHFGSSGFLKHVGSLTKTNADMFHKRSSEQIQSFQN